MGMLGHQATASPVEPAAEPEVDELAKQVEEIETELNVTELAAEATDIGRRSELIAAIRARLESLLASNSSTVALQRAALHPVLEALGRVAPRLDMPITFPENAFRVATLELLGRLPVGEVPKARVNDLTHACHAVLNEDHEDNGAVAQRLLFDVHKAYKQALEDATGPFFDWLKTLFEGMPAAAERQLEAAAAGGDAPRPLLAARESMKIAQDVALMIFFLVQTHAKRMGHYGPTLLPLMVSAAAMPGPDLESVSPAAMPIYTEFRMAQVKTMMVILALSRSQHMAPMLANHREQICGALIHLMATAPDSLPVRKEVLTCFRNILSTPFRPGLQSRIDDLLNIKILLGTGQVSAEVMRQTAFSNLAELVAVSKTELTLKQLQKIVRMFTRNVLDVSSPVALQSTSLRLLYNIIEVLFSRRATDVATAEACREMLSNILECMVAKLSALRDQVPRHVRDLRDLEDARKERKAGEASGATDAETAGKRSLASRRKQLKEEVALVKKAAEEAEAAAKIAAAEAGPAAVAGQEGSEPAAAAAVEGAAAGGGAPAEGAVAAAPSAEEADKPSPMATDGDAEAPAVAPAAEPAAVDAAAAEAPQAEAMEEDKQPEASAAAPAAAGEVKEGETPADTTAAAAPAAPQEKQEEDEEEEEEEEEAEAAATPSDVPPPPPFRSLIQAPVGISAKEREVVEFRSLLHTVVTCLKNVIYITVAFHTPRNVPGGLPFAIQPWSTRPSDVRAVSHVLTFGLPAISFFEHGFAPPNFDAREVLADLFTVFSDGREFSDIFAPRMAFLYDLVLSNRWYMHFLRHLLDGEHAARLFTNRNAAACYLRFLVAEKLDTLDDPDSPEGKLTLELLEACFESLPRIQTSDMQKGPQHGVVTVERAVLPHVVAFLRGVYPKLAAGGPAARGPMHAMRSLFFSIAATNKFQEIQAAVGASGLHARIVDAALAIMQGPSARTREEEEAAAELCLLVPARLEHLIPLLPRMMHAAVRALNGSDRSVHVALRVLDVWVESFNPEFIERSMAAVMKPLMAALWSHIRPPPHPFGAKVAEMLGKMGGRGRRWLGDSVSVDFKAIPEYGLRVILAFPPHTSFLVPLDRCVQLAWATVESPSNDANRRKNALRLLQICVGTLARLTLPADMMASNPPPAPTVPVEATEAKGNEPAGTTTGGTGEPVEATAMETDAPEPATVAGGGASDAADGGDDALGRLQHLLFGGARPPQIPSDFQWPQELGVKTKKQHTAEKQMLETVLTAMMASAAVDAELEGAHAKEFAHATCRHFALLLASGWAANATAPPAPPSSRITKYGVRGGIPAYVATLKHLQPHVLLDAFQQGLKQTSSAARDAVVECMEVFLDTLVEVGEVQLREKERKKQDSEAHSGGSAGAAAEKAAAEKAAPVAGATAADDQKSLSETVPYLNVQQDLVMRAMHCCYGDTWPSRLGGVAALKALASRMPQRWLLRAANYITKALMAVLRSLPDNAVREKEEITGVLLDIVRRALDLPEGTTTPSDPAVVATEQPEQTAQPPAAAMEVEVEPEEEAAAQTGRRGKRTKRGGAQPARKRQQRGSGGEEAAASPPEKDEGKEAPPSSEPKPEGEEAEEDVLPDGLRRLQNDLLQAVMSSKSNDVVRAAATQCLQLLALHAKTSVGAMLNQMLTRQPSARSILERRILPLRSIAAQTNYAHSTAFLLRSCPEQLKLTPSLATFVADACTLMEVDDTLLGNSVVMRGQPPKADVTSKLQVACMEVLVAALNWPAFRDAKDVEVVTHNWGTPGETTIPVQQLRDRIMKVFIRRLGSPSDRVVALATEGVQTTLKHDLLEKSVLQEGLRPILMDLAVYQRMTLHLLRHVHRLLDLLAGQFNVTLGQKLTEHLQKWMEVEKYLHAQTQPVAWEPGTEWEIAASMLDIFHKLPPAAKEFLETHEGRTGIVVLTIGLEEALSQLPGAVLPSKMWSPYRAPLARFLNRYPDESVVYFLDSTSRLSKPEYFLRLLDIIRNPIGRPLLNALKGAADKFVNILEKTAEGDKADTDLAAAQYNAVHLLRAITKLSPDWLPKELYTVLLARWRSSSEPQDGMEEAEEETLRNLHMERKWLAELLLNYARRHQEEVEVLFDLSTAFALDIVVDFNFLKDFMSREFPRETSTAQKRVVLNHWMERFTATKSSSPDAVNVMRYLINPMVSWALSHDQQDMLTPKITQKLVDILQDISAEKAGYSEQIQTEAIQLCASLVQHSPSSVEKFRKEVIQYVWWTLKQDNMAKPHAFLCVAHFFRAFQKGVADKVVLQAFVNMVRVAPPDSVSREVVKQAIDLIVPILTEAGDPATVSSPGPVEPVSVAEASEMTSLGDLPPTLGSGSGKKKPTYAALLRRVLAEEGPQSPALLIILQMLVRNREAFFLSRATFMPTMISNLNRLGLSNQASLESRLLAVDMAATMYWWDAKAAESEPEVPDEGPQPMDIQEGDDQEGSTPQTNGELRLSPAMDENVMNFLLRMAFVSCEVRDRDEVGWRKLHAHCMEVLKDAARYRPATPLKLAFFDKLLHNSMQQQHAQQGQQAPEASPMLKFQPDNIVTCCPNQIAMMIEPAIYGKNRTSVELLASVARSLFSAFPPTLAERSNKTGAVGVALKIQSRIRDILNKYLNHVADPSQFSLDFLWYACNCVNVMKSAMEPAPQGMQPVIHSLLKAMNRLAKDHNQQPQAALLSSKGPAKEAPTDADYSTGAWFMFHALSVAVPSALVLSADHRKLFLSTLVMLITGQSVRQGQTDAGIIFEILALMRRWLLAPKQTYLTHKELLVLLQRLAQIDRLHAIPMPLKHTWDEKFLDLLYTVITTKKEDNFGDEVFMRVERNMCCGLQSSDPETRQKFFTLYSDRIARDLFDRLRYIIQYQDWDSLSHTFWLKHAVALLFDCLHMRDSITLAYNSAHVPSLFNYKESFAFPPTLHPHGGAPSGFKPPETTGTSAPATGTEGAAVKSEQAGGEAAATAAAGEGEGAAGAGADAAEPASGDATAPSAPATAPASGADPVPRASGQTGTSGGAGGSRATGGSSRGGPAPVLDIPLPEGLKAKLEGHLEFLREHSGLRSDALVSCLIEQVQNDPMVAHHLWVLLFPIVWTSLLKEQQTGLAKPIIQLLSKEHHLRQAFLRPTVGQTLLDGISMSQPQPKIPAEMIKYMGRHFHAWHTAISMLESHVGLFPQDMRCFDAVCDLYTALGEEDMRCGLWQRRAAADETKTAVALQQHGFLVEAQSLFLEMMSRGVSGGVSGVTKSEMVLWHNQYLSCCAELNQWDTVAEYAKSTDNSALQLEAAAKLHDWVHLKQMAVPKAQVEEGAEFTMIKAQMALSDASILEVDKLCKTALNQCVVRWWQMPESSPWSYAPVLHSFQRAVELSESWRVMMEFSMQGGPQGQYQDLKDIADTWKLRTPNEWEPVRWWSDVLTWRNQVYNMTIRQFSAMQAANPNLHQMGYRDKAWSVNRLGHVARLHHLPEACVHMINTLYGFNAMEVQEAFVKVQEQAKAYMLRPSEHLHGLNLINSTNMDYFQNAHQAEMFCLKAQFLHLLNEPDAANSTFSEALTLWSLCPDAWVSWGRFCDDRYTALRQPQSNPQLLEFAAAAYTQGIRLSGTEARNLVPRLLNLLMLDSHGPEAVGRQLVQQAGDLPTWVWLPWVPQLVTGLQRPETAAARRILVAAASQHPQYIYWHIRPVVVSLKDAAYKAATVARERAAAAAAAASAPATGEDVAAAGASGAAEDASEPKSASKEDKDSSAKKKGSVPADKKGGATPASAKKSAGGEDEYTEMADAAAAAPVAAVAGTPIADPAAAAAGASPAMPSQPPAAGATPGGAEPAGGVPRIEKPMEVIAYDNAKEVMEALRAKQTPALQSLDVLITELGQRFATRTDERLLAVVYTLQHRTYKAQLPASAPVPEGLKKELQSVCRACSGREGAGPAPPAAGGGGGSSGSWSSWSRYQQEFARDLDPESEAAPRTLGELTDRLKGWRVMMESMIEDMHPAVAKLEEHAPALVDMALEEVEVPCQAPPCPDGPDPVFIERIGADVEVVRRSCASARRLTVFGSDGQVRHFLLAGHQSSGVGQGEERVGQLLRAANGLLLTHPESRRRGLAFIAPRSQALFPSGRIVEDDPSTCLYVDAYETYCARYGREPDAPVVLFRERTCGEDGAPADDAARKAAYDEIVERMVNENIFSQYMYKTMVENSRMMWTFKRQFALSTAMSAVACFVLRLSGRSPSKLAVSKARGELTQLELAATYNDRLQMDIIGETVPFRLTRNMSAFIGPHGFEGALIAAAVAAAQGLLQEKSCLPSQLALFLRDDVLAFVQRRLVTRAIASIKLPAQQVETAVNYNVNQCLTRLEKVGPRSSVTPPTNQQGQLLNPQAGMRELVAVAASSTNLSKMPPEWQPWF